MNAIFVAGFALFDKPYLLTDNGFVILVLFKIIIRLFSQTLSTHYVKFWIKLYCFGDCQSLY